MRADEGSATVVALVLLPTLLLCAGLVLDGGAALAAEARAMGEAAEAARAGADTIDVNAYRRGGYTAVDPVRAEAAANAFLAASGDRYQVTVNGDAVTVTVTAAWKTQLLNLAGLDVLHVVGTATAHPVTTPARTP
jgi:zona occludens toxin (predicted ATPase)